MLYFLSKYSGCELAVTYSRRRSSRHAHRSVQVPGDTRGFRRCGDVGPIAGAVCQRVVRRGGRRENIRLATPRFRFRSFRSSRPLFLPRKFRASVVSDKAHVAGGRRAACLRSTHTHTHTHTHTFNGPFSGTPPLSFLQARCPSCRPTNIQ